MQKQLRFHFPRGKKYAKIQEEKLIPKIRLRQDGNVCAAKEGIHDYKSHIERL